MPTALVLGALDHKPAADRTAEANRYFRSLDAMARSNLARSLGLSAASLTALRCGWSRRHMAWTFPMTDPTTRQVTGIRLRLPGGKKLSVKGGHESLFIPSHQPGDVMAVAEGPTDTAALLDLGLTGAVGRPSCSGGVRHLLRLAQIRRPRAVVIFSDNDDPGREGARALAQEMKLVCPVRVVAPPAKDVRAWLQAGATRHDASRLLEGL